MRKLLLLLTVSILTSVAFAQDNHCATAAHEAMLMEKYPDYAQKRAAIEAYTSKVIQKQQAEHKSMTGVVITIPVVFHVVYKTAVQNIDDATLLEQIQVLKEDFRRLNADTTNTPDAFTPVAADCEIEFCLAVVDPDGNPTTGIRRISTTVNSFGVDDAVKFSADGGDDAWPATDYLNFWVCNLGASLLGYAQFPGGPAATDGVVIHYNHVGLNDAGYPYHLGRTATHEIGHWLNLYHIWGDDGACGGTDLVDDTPNEKVETYGCPAFPHTDVCSPDFPGVMFMNYMDYTDDGCMNIFTQGQKARMMALFDVGGARFSITNSDGCGLEMYDAQALAALPGGTTCNTTVTPTVTIKNHGSELLNSLDILYAVDGGAPATFDWTGTLASMATEEVTLPAITTTEGSHTLDITLENPNGYIDGDMADNLSSTDFIVSLTGLPMPLSQGFEATGFPYSGYTLSNPDSYYTWERTNDAASTGTYSMYINDYDNDAIGEVDELTLPAYDFSGMTDIYFNFDVAYALYTASGAYSDTLEVLVSNDCGANWSTVYKKANPDLQTAPFTTSSFVPADDEWRTESVDLSPWLSSSQVFVKFRTISDYENNLYIDNINISDSEPLTTMNFSGNVHLSLFPNPVNDEINLRYLLTGSGDCSISVYDVLGCLVSSNIVTAISGFNSRQISVAGLAPGYYRIEVRSGGQSATAPFIKE